MDEFRLARFAVTVKHLQDVAQAQPHHLKVAKFLGRHGHLVGQRLHPDAVGVAGHQRGSIRQAPSLGAGGDQRPAVFQRHGEVAKALAQQRPLNQRQAVFQNAGQDQP